MGNTNEAIRTTIGATIDQKAANSKNLYIASRSCRLNGDCIFTLRSKEDQDFTKQLNTDELFKFVVSETLGSISTIKGMTAAEVFSEAPDYSQAKLRIHYNRITIIK